MDVVSLGPLLIPTRGLIGIAALLVALVVGAALGRGRGVRIVDRLMAMALVGGLAARLVFVATYAPLYIDAPLAILDIRDRGFSLWGGAAGLALYAGVAGWRAQAAHGPLAGALAAGTLTLVLGIAGLNAVAPAHPAMPGTPLARSDGASVTLAELRQQAPGKPMVGNLWASWCGPCRREMPMLARFQATHDDVTAVFVNEDESAAAMQQFLAQTDLSLGHSLIDTGHALANALAIPGYPTTLFYGPDGRLVSRHTGLLSRATLARGVDSAMH